MYLSVGRYVADVASDDASNDADRRSSYVGRSLGVSVPIMGSTLTLASSLIGRDLEQSGRTLDRLGLAGLDARGIREVARTGRRLGL